MGYSRVLKIGVLLLLVTQVSLAHDDGCLTPEQDKQLKTSINYIEKALNVVSLGLNAASEIERDEQVKQKLKEAAVVVAAINRNLISNLTGIVEEACGRCSEILKTIKDAVADIEKTLVDIEPDWKGDPIYLAVTTAIDAVEKLAENLCSSKNFQGKHYDDESCLTPKQDEELKISMKYIEKFLEVVSVALKAAGEIEKDEKIKQQLEESATIINDINNDLVFDLQRIVEEACGQCSDILKTVQDAVADIEKTLLDIEPEWKDNEIYQAISTALDAILKVGEDLCPSRSDDKWEMNLSVVDHAHEYGQNLKKDSCLSPEQDGEIEEVTKFAEWVFNVAVIGLNHVASKLPDGDQKKELQEAARVLQDISEDIIKNIKSIADEDCGTCTDIVKAVSDAFDDIEKLFTDIDPEWKDNKIFEAVTHAMQLFIDKVRELCPKYHQLVRKDDCLTPQQDEKLKVSIDYIEKLLGAAVLALDTVAAMEQDPQVKAKVKEAAIVVKAVNQDLVTKLTKIVEEACGSCSDIVDTINDAIDAIVNTLAGIDPNWNNEPKFQAFAAAIKFLGKLAEMTCSNSTSTKVQKSCLTPQQDEELQDIADFAEKAFDVAAIGLRHAAFKQTDAKLKQQMLEAADVVQAISNDIVKNLKTIADESCGTCSDVVQAVEDSFDALDQTFRDIDPDWKTKPLFEVLGYAMNIVFDKIKETCKDRQTFPAFLSKDPCLTPEEREKMDKIVNYVNEFLNSATVAIENTISRIDDDDMKEKLKMVEIVVKAVKKDIVNNIEKVANEFCGTCADVVKAIKDSLKYLEQTVKDIDPEWENNAAFSVLEVAITGALKMADELCKKLPNLDQKYLRTSTY